MEFIHEDRFEVHSIEAVTTESGRRYKIPNGDMYESVTTALGNQPGKKEVVVPLFIRSSKTILIILMIL